MKELVIGGVLKKNIIYEFEINDLNDLKKAREVVKSAWPSEEYDIVAKDKKTYRFSKSFLSWLIDNAEDYSKHSEKNQGTPINEKKIPQYISNEGEIPKNDEKLDQIILMIQNLEKSIADGNPETQKSKEEVNQNIQTQVVIDEIKPAFDNLNHELENVYLQLTELNEKQNRLMNANSLALDFAEIGNMDMHELLSELYNTSCKINQMIIETTLQLVDKEL